MKYSLVAALILQSTVVLGDLLPVHFKAPSPAHFHHLISNDTLDFGCRARAQPLEDGSFKLAAHLTEDQISHLSNELSRSAEAGVTLHREPTARASPAPIGTGDRFNGGATAPSGLGTKPSGSTISTMMNVKEIDSAIKGLANVYGVSTITLPYKTFEGRTQTAAYVGAGTDKSAYHLYMSAGMHARERGGPDQVLYWISDMLAASKSGSGLTYGKKTYTNAQVKSVLAAGIVFFPLVNADGVVYDQANSNYWRKNRNTKSGSSGSSVGVDLNRNFDFVWDFPKYFAPGTSPASTSPSSETYKGTAAASEPETKNHMSLYDQFPKIRWFMDVHSAVGDILYSWGDDENQSEDPDMNFKNPAYDGKRGEIGDTDYKEYISTEDVNNAKTVAQKCAAGMAAAGGRQYSAQPASGLYATSGATDDYSFSRTFASNGAKNKVYGYTMEFGPTGNFYPSLSEFNQNIIDTGAGFMEWALAAIAVGVN